MLNLAAFKYRRALAASGGPIAKIVSSPVSIYGRCIYQADAFLAPGLGAGKTDLTPDREADGTGSSKSPEIARHMAVSEAIERWAFDTESTGNNAGRYGFTPGCPAAGMAAFPGLFKYQARRRARLEALELLSIVAWWGGYIDASPGDSGLPGIELLRLHAPANFGEVVIVYRRSKSGHVSYGHAAGCTLAGATSRAVVELAYNDQIITRHKLFARTQRTLDPFGRRCLHFASPEGHQEFIERLRANPSHAVPRWDPLFDGEITGPWTRYATVWRTALRLPTQDFLDPRINFFYW